MHDRVIDLEAQIRRIKANENFLAFAGFTLDIDGAGEPLDGVAKVSGRLKGESSSGFLTLSLLVDVAERPGLRDALAEAFRALEEDALRPKLGKSFEYMVETETGEDESSAWFMKDLTFFYKELETRAPYYLSARILPALSSAMPIRFDPPQWWDETPDLRPGSGPRNRP